MRAPSRRLDSLTNIYMTDTYPQLTLQIVEEWIRVDWKFYADYLQRVTNSKGRKCNFEL